MSRAPLVDTLEARQMFSGSTQVVGYLPDWEFTPAVVQKMDWAALSQVNYFSVTPNATTGKLNTGNTADFHVANLDATVKAAHAKGVKVSLVVGGAGLDGAFPTIAASDAKRNAFAQSVKSFAASHKLDGVDLDWEPLEPTAAQVTNFGKLIHAVKLANPKLTLSAAVNPEMLPTGTDYDHKQWVLSKTAIADLNQIGVMAYDLDYAYHSAWTRSTQDLNKWGSYLAANGVSKTKLLFGLPFYARAGTSWDNSTTKTYGEIVNAQIAKTGSGPAANVDNLPLAFADSFGGQSTQWYFNGKTAIAAKTGFAIDAKIGGVMIWDLGSDHFAGGNYDSYSLLPAIKNTVKARGNTIPHVAATATTAKASIFSSTPVTTQASVASTLTGSATDARYDFV